MPVSKSRTKDDTWKEADLKKALQGERTREKRDEKSKEKSSHRDDGRRERRSDRDDDRRRRRENKDELANGEDKERERRRRDRDKEADKDRKRDRDKDDERSSRDKESRRERQKQRERVGESSGIGIERERERRHRSRREQDKDSAKDEVKSRDRDQDGRSEKDKERRKRREERESSSHKDRSGDRRREKSKEGDSRERRKDHDASRERRERSKDRRERRKDGDDSREKQREKSRERGDRARRKHESETENRAQHREKEMLASLKQQESIKSKDHPPEGERFRADTLEKAEVVEEEDNTKGRKKRNSVGRRGSTNADEVTEEGGADEYYEEDFEDYDDDFENDHDDDDDDNDDDGDDDNEQESDSNNIEERNAGMQELLKAINLENETVRVLSREGSKLSRSSDDDSKRETPVRPPTAKGRINFVAAKRKQISEKVASRTRKRGQELMHLIDLDVVVFDMFDLPPMNEYELYIKNFGRSDTKQAYVQCNDDNLEKEIQTEEIETRTMWTQNPAEDFAGCGGEDGSKDDFSMMENQTNIDSVHLVRFLQSAGQVCLILLEEASAEKSSTMVKEKKDLSCSDGYIPLATKQPYLAGRAIESIHVSPVQSHLLLTAYRPITDQSKGSSKISETFNSKSVICLWNMNEPSQPQKVLICESVPRCCCLSPSKATIAFAGLEDGSVVAWDLRESSPVHPVLNVDNTPVTLRSPTFSTAGVLSQDNHHSPVISLLPVVMPGDSTKASSSLGGSLQADEMLGLSFQLASLEEDAVINIWVVVELENGDVAGSQSDLGLAPGGKIKLIKSASLSLELPLRGVRKTTALQTLCMRFLPQDPNHFYIGTDSGCILHTVRHGGRAPPKAYKQQTECLVDVTALDVSPWQLPCILAGSKDGSIRLYNLSNECPQSTWSNSTKGSAIVYIQWSNSIPSVFYVLDANSTLYIWDLLQDESSPVSIEKLKQGSVVCFELSSDYTASGIGVPGRSPELVLGYHNGMVEVHKISAPFAQSSPDGLDRFHSYLEAAV